MYKVINPTVAPWATPRVKGGREREDRVKIVLIKVWKFPPGCLESTLKRSDQSVFGVVWETDIAKYLNRLVILLMTNVAK